MFRAETTPEVEREGFPIQRVMTRGRTRSDWKGDYISEIWKIGENPARWL